MLDGEATADLDSNGVLNARDKIIQVVQDNGLESVGTYDDGMNTFQVFDFPATALDSFTNGAGKSPSTYIVQGSQLVEAELAPASGS